MSGNRIRYMEYHYRENSHISINAYTSASTGAIYRIILDFKEMKFMIRNERNKEFVSISDKYTNLNVLKRSAREELERFGVDLNKEVRDRTFGLCEKGMTESKWRSMSKEEKETQPSKVNSPYTFDLED